MHTEKLTTFTINEDNVRACTMTLSLTLVTQGSSRVKGVKLSDTVVSPAGNNLLILQSPTLNKLLTIHSKSVLYGNVSKSFSTFLKMITFRWKEKYANQSLNFEITNIVREWTLNLIFMFKHFHWIVNSGNQKSYHVKI